MSAFIEFTQYQAEAFVVCLLVSLFWAGALLIGARGVERWGAISSAERLWIGALLLAVLPSLVAPTFAGLGLSLRAAPEAVTATYNVAASAFAPTPNVVAAPRVEPFDIDKIIGAAAILYIYGALLAFFLWATKNVGLYYAVSRATPVGDRRLLSGIEYWADRLGVRAPTLKQSRHVSSVCILGVLRQTILIPEGIEARVGRADLVLMCAHELAHVKRGDTKLFTATQIARILFWFNPLVARIAANAELAAEERADALVLAYGVDRRAYAAVFVEGLKFAAFRKNAQTALVHALAPSFTPPDRRGRRRRLTAILSADTPQKAPLVTRLMLSAAGAAVALAAVGQAALAVDPESAAARRASLNDMPIIGDVTSAFGEKHVRPDGSLGPAHAGVDIKAPRGAGIFAPGDGVVVEATDLYNREPAWGKVVIVDHGHGLVTRYAHLDSYRVKAGDRVKAGERIAAVGATGKVTGPHLHFETLRDGVAVDPADVIAAAPAAAAAVEPVEPIEPVAPVERLDAAPPASVAAPVDVVDAPAPAIPVDEAAAFADELTNRMMADAERRLLGAAEGGASGAFNLTLRHGDKVYRFSSDEPMTAERRADLRAALADMRAAQAATPHAANKRQRDLEHQAEAFARHAEHWRDMQSEAQTFTRDQERLHEALAISAQDRADFLREFQLSRRALLDLQRQAIIDARADFAADEGQPFDDAAADLDDAERDIADVDLSPEARREARARIDAARRALESDRQSHERAIKETRRSLDAQQEAIEREIDLLDAPTAMLQ